MAKKNDTLCFDIGTLDQDQKVKFAKRLKTTVDNFNKEVTKSTEQDKDSKNES